MDEQSQCEQRYAGDFFGIGCQQALDAAHFLSAGIVSFARGLNDTPKMAALLLILPEPGVRSSLVAAVAIALGGLLSARRASGEDNEPQDHRHEPRTGLSANFATGMLVMAASLFGLQVSTTHVSVGALFGFGLTSRQAGFRVIRNIRHPDL
jgi:PiT family inorganic phosphate transporter